jgi:signal peptidase II
MNVRARPFALAGLVLVLDRITKLVIERRVSALDTFTVIPDIFDIVHTRNRGIAFGLFNDSSSEMGSFVLIGFSLLILGFIGTLLWQYSRGFAHEHWTLRYGLGLVLGGALGNLLDRVLHGSVTDFLDFHWGVHHFPVFNLADSAISVGAAMLLLDLWWGERRAKSVTP